MYILYLRPLQVKVSNGEAQLCSLGYVDSVGTVLVGCIWRRVVSGVYEPLVVIVKVHVAVGQGRGCGWGCLNLSRWYLRWWRIRHIC